MSYEGFTQVLCANGHLQEFDCYDSPDDPCPVCGEKIVWRNEVDVTNGSWDENDNRIDGYVKLQLAEDPKTCTCAACGHTHPLSEARYKIPTKGETEHVLGPRIGFSPVVDYEDDE